MTLLNFYWTNSPFTDQFPRALDGFAKNPLYP